MDKVAFKRSPDPLQERLRERKYNWNKATSEFIAKMIDLKKAINGRTGKHGLPASKIQNPFPAEIASFLSELTSNYQALAQEAEAIIQEQEAYSRERRQPTKMATASLHNAPQRVGEVSLGSTTLKTLLALTSMEKERGLMERNEPTVMSFVFAGGVNKFWMHKTPCPLDLIFSNNGRIIDICYGEPYSLRMVGPDTPSDIVVEVPYGTCQKLGINIGDPLTLTF